MRATKFGLAALFATAGVAAAIASAPAALADPTCVNTGSTTIQCSSPGNTQISTSPSVIAGGPTWLYPYADPWYGHSSVIDPNGWGGGIVYGNNRR